MLFCLIIAELTQRFFFDRIMRIFSEKEFLNSHKIYKLFFIFLLKKRIEYDTMRTIHFTDYGGFANEYYQ